MGKAYNLVYRCRLCGEEFEGVTENAITEGYAAEGFVLMLCSDDSFSSARKTGRRYHPHKCNDGSVGFAEFLGLKMIDEMTNKMAQI